VTAWKMSIADVNDEDYPIVQKEVPGLPETPEKFRLARDMLHKGSAAASNILVVTVTPEHIKQFRSLKPGEPMNAESLDRIAQMISDGKIT
jgi:hypothetical protein